MVDLTHYFLVENSNNFHLKISSEFYPILMGELLFL